MANITIVNWVYKPTYNWGAPSCNCFRWRCSNNRTHHPIELDWHLSLRAVGADRNKFGSGVQKRQLIDPSNQLHAASKSKTIINLVPKRRSLYTYTSLIQVHHFYQFLMVTSSYIPGFWWLRTQFLSNPGVPNSWAPGRTWTSSFTIGRIATPQSVSGMFDAGSWHCQRSR